MEIRPARAGDFDVMWGMFKTAIATQDALPLPALSPSRRFARIGSRPRRLM